MKELSNYMRMVIRIGDGRNFKNDVFKKNIFIIIIFNVKKKSWLLNIIFILKKLLWQLLSIFLKKQTQIGTIRFPQKNLQSGIILIWIERLRVRRILRVLRIYYPMLKKTALKGTKFTVHLSKQKFLFCIKLKNKKIK